VPPVGGLVVVMRNRDDESGGVGWQQGPGGTPEAVLAEVLSPGVEDEGTGLVVADDGHGVPELEGTILRGDGGKVRDTKGLEEGLVDGEGDGDGPAVGDLKLDRVDIVRTDRVPRAGRVLFRLMQYCPIGLNPTVGRLAIMGEDVELRIPFPLEEIKGGVIGDALVDTTVELVPDEATGEGRLLVRMSFPVGDLLDGREGLTDAGGGQSLVVDPHDVAGE